MNLQEAIDHEFWFTAGPEIQGHADALKVLGDTARRVSKADQIWKCIKHGCDVTEILTQHQPLFNPAEEYCALEAEWGMLDPKNCEIVRGVFIPVKEAPDGQ